MRASRDPYSHSASSTHPPRASRTSRRRSVRPGAFFSRMREAFPRAVVSDSRPEPGATRISRAARNAFRVFTSGAASAAASRAVLRASTRVRESGTAPSPAAGRRRGPPKTAARRSGAMRRNPGSAMATPSAALPREEPTRERSYRGLVGAPAGREGGREGGREEGRGGRGGEMQFGASGESPGFGELDPGGRRAPQRSSGSVKARTVNAVPRESGPRSRTRRSGSSGRSGPAASLLLPPAACPPPLKKEDRSELLASASPPPCPGR